MSRGIRIAPSILSADLGHLAREIAIVEAGGADWIHVDVVDGHFAPHLTFGPLVVRASRNATRLPLDVHLMVDDPDQYLEAFSEAGATHLTVHREATRDLEATLDRIHALGKQAGVALRPETSSGGLEKVIDRVDLVLLLCVHPGRAGQSFMESQLDRIADVRTIIERSGRDIHLEVDGGVGPSNAARIAAAGADVLVAGSQIFGAEDRAAAIRALREAARAAH